MGGRRRWTFHLLRLFLSNITIASLSSCAQPLTLMFDANLHLAAVISPDCRSLELPLSLSLTVPAFSPPQQTTNIIPLLQTRSARYISSTVFAQALPIN